MRIIKSLGLQMIPWCIRFMGNHVICCVHQRSDEADRMETIKLIKSDGVVKIYHRPIIASELMLEFPKHLVCHSDSFYIGQKIPALSENDELQLGHKYFLLPKHFFQSVLSFVTIASFASSSSSRSSRNEFLKKAVSCQPFDIQKTPSGSMQIRISDEFISRLIEDGKIKDEEGCGENSNDAIKGRVCTTPQLQKDYNQLVSSRNWRPKLETIRESGKRRKLESFTIKGRNKSQRREIHKKQKIKIKEV